MKKVSGTLKLDQAQFTELQAFAKFGSDIDAATQAVLDKGIRNVEILKQPQYTPYKVEDQIAIIFCGTKGLLQKVPVKSVKDFETELLNTLHEKHQDLMDQLKAGKIDDNITAQLQQICVNIAKNYEK